MASQLEGVRIQFRVNEFYLRNLQTDARTTVRSVTAAIDFLQKNDGWYSVDGTYDGNGGIDIYPTATSPDRFVLPRSSGPRRRFDFGRPGGYAQIDMSGIENVLQTISHEYGHHLGIEHGERMLEHEWQQLRYYRESQ